MSGRTKGIKKDLSHDGYPARAIGTHKKCRLGKGSIVLLVNAPRVYRVCGCDEKLMDQEIKFDKPAKKAPRRPPFLTFCPSSRFSHATRPTDFGEISALLLATM